MLNDADEFLLRMHTKLSIDVPDVRFYGIVRQYELFLDNRTCSSSSEQHEHICFAISKAESTCNCFTRLIKTFARIAFYSICLTLIFCRAGFR